MMTRTWTEAELTDWYTWLRTKCRSEDAVQDAMVKLVTCLPEHLWHDVARQRAWLATCAYRAHVTETSTWVDGARRNRGRTVRDRAPGYYEGRHPVEPEQHRVAEARADLAQVPTDLVTYELGERAPDTRSTTRVKRYRTRGALARALGRPTVRRRVTWVTRGRPL